MKMCPLVKIEIKKGKSVEYKKALFDHSDIARDDFQ